MVDLTIRFTFRNTKDCTGAVAVAGGGWCSCGDRDSNGSGRGSSGRGSCGRDGTVSAVDAVLEFLLLFLFLFLFLLLLLLVSVALVKVFLLLLLLLLLLFVIKSKNTEDDF